MNTLNIKYLISVVIFDNTRKKEMKFKKEFNKDIVANEDAMYDNYHVVSKKYILDYFTEEIREYTNKTGIESDITGDSNLLVNEFEIFSLTDDVEIFFENEEDPEQFTLYPTIKVYIPPKSRKLDKPTLRGKLIDDITIKWEWNDDGCAHYLVDEYKNVLAQVPLGVSEYIESGLEYGKNYTRMLVSFNSKVTSDYSAKVTILTSKSKTENGDLVNYSETRNTGYEEEVIEPEHERMTAFKSGVGHGNDLLVVKGHSDGIDVRSELDFDLYGYGDETISFYPKVSFAYRHTFKANWLERVRDGLLKIRTLGYPHEKSRIRLYRYAVKPLTITYKVQGSVSYKYTTGSGENERVRAKTETVSFTGTYNLSDTLSNVEYNSQGFARMKPVRETLLGGTGILSRLGQECSGTYSGGFDKEWFNVRILDNYNCDKMEPWRDTMGTGADGTFRICSDTDGKVTNSHKLIAIGHADAQLYEIEIFKEAEFNMWDNGGDYTIYNSTDFAKPLKNVADRSQTYSGSNIVTKAEAVYKGLNTRVNLNSDSVTLTITKTLDSGIKTYTFTNENHTVSFRYKDLFTDNLPDDYTSMYRFRTEILADPAAFHNIYYKSKTQLSPGDIISEFVTANNNLQFEAKSYEVERVHTEIFPPANEEPLHGVVNGREDEFIRKHYGKDDFIIKAHAFPLHNKFYNLTFGVQLSDVNPHAAKVDCIMATSGGTTTNLNEDVITFSSSYTQDKKIPITGVVSSKVVEAHLTDEYDHKVDTEMHIDRSITSVYDRFELEVKSKNPEVIVVTNTKNVPITGGTVNVSSVVKALRHPSSKWSPSVHNGYYYINQHEHYICSESKPISQKNVEVDKIGYGTVSFNVVVTTQTGSKITKGYSFKIKFDEKEYVVVDDIVALIEPWLETMGITREDIKNLELVQLDNDTIIDCTSESINVDNSPDMAEIFNSWLRFSHGKPQYENEKNSWAWNNETKKIECQINSNNYIGFISNDKVEKYKARVRVTSRCTWDNDMMGFVIAYLRDTDGTEYTLSAVRDLNNNNSQWRVLYNYGLSGYFVAGNNSSRLSPVAGTIWSQYLPQGSVIQVERNKNIVRVACSDAGSNVINPDSMIEIDLSSSKFSKLNQPCSYGFSCHSQTYCTFDEIEIIDYKNVIGPVTAKSKETLIIKEVTDYVDIDDNTLTISPIPQQFSPIMVESEKYGIHEYVENLNCNESNEYIEQDFVVNSKDKLVTLDYSNIDESSIIVTLNYIITNKFTVKNNVIIFDNYLNEGDVLNIKYKVKNSFTVNYDFDNDRVLLNFNSDENVGVAKVSYETNVDDNLLVLNHLSFNPIHNTDYSGFVYLTNDMEEPKYVKIHISVKSLFRNVKDRVRVYVQVLDKYYNPVENERVALTCSKGSLLVDNNMTDINGVVAATYTCPDTLGKVTFSATCNGIVDTKEINIKER